MVDLVIEKQCSKLRKVFLRYYLLVSLIGNTFQIECFSNFSNFPRLFKAIKIKALSHQIQFKVNL